MKANLAREGFVGAEKLNRAEIITAVQAAIWAYSNENVGQYTYGRSFSVPHNTQWGGSLHDFTNEMDVWWTEGKRKFSTNEEVANRINSLIKQTHKNIEIILVNDGSKDCSKHALGIQQGHRKASGIPERLQKVEASEGKA